MSLLSDDLSSDSDDYEEDETASSAAAAINAIYSELNLPSLRALQPTRVLPPKPA